MRAPTVLALLDVVVLAGCSSDVQSDARTTETPALAAAVATGSYP